MLLFGFSESARKLHTILLPYAHCIFHICFGFWFGHVGGLYDVYILLIKSRNRHHPHLYTHSMNCRCRIFAVNMVGWFVDFAQIFPASTSSHARVTEECNLRIFISHAFGRTIFVFDFQSGEMYMQRTEE